MVLAARPPTSLEDPPREIALRRLARAEELSMSYHEYALEILERRRFL
jgi:hypothetical protein